MNDDEFGELLAAYEARFGEAPPLFQLPEDQAAAGELLRQAIEAGTTDPVENYLPPGVDA